MQNPDNHSEVLKFIAENKGILAELCSTPLGSGSTDIGFLCIT